MRRVAGANQTAALSGGTSTAPPAAPPRIQEDQHPRSEWDLRGTKGMIRNLISLKVENEMIRSLMD